MTANGELFGVNDFKCSIEALHNKEAKTQMFGGGANCARVLGYQCELEETFIGLELKCWRTYCSGSS